MKTNHEAFEELTYTMFGDHFVTDGDKASVHWSMHSSRRRAVWNNIQPTGNETHITDMTFFRLREGKIAEAAVVSDAFSLMMELDAIELKQG